MLWYRVCQWGKGEKTDVTTPVGNSLEPQPTLIGALRRIPGFRIDRRKKLPLHEILAIAVCAVISGATGFRDYERFGREKRKWLKRFLRLENGIPSHDTFARVFSLMDPKRFNAVVVDWLRSVVDVEGDVISVDGKILRRAFTKAGKRPCIVSAHSHRTKLVIGQVKADEKSNEITAIPELLDLLYLKGAIVTIDAAGCQRKTVKKIVRRGAHHLISLKGSQSTMHDEIKAFMDDRTLQKDFDKAVSVTCARGKVETRTCRQSGDPDWFADKWKWHGPKSVCKVRCEVYDKKTGTTTVDERYFISSMSVDAKKALDTVRAHWGVEAMHWILDMDFDEDHSRARTGNAAENLAMPRHVVLNVLRLDRTIFGGISKKRKELTWNEDKLFRLLLAA